MPNRVYRLRACRTAGAATLEYVGAMALAAILVLSLVLPSVGAGTGSGTILTTAVCKVKTALGMANCDTAPEPPPPPTPPPFNPKPAKCKVSEHSEKAKGEVKVWFFKIGQNAGLVKTLYSDGTVNLTVTDGAGLGLTGGSGGKVAAGKLERENKVDFGGGVEFDYGSTWTFKDEAEATAMQGQLDRYLEQERQLNPPFNGRPNPGMWFYYRFIKGFTDPPKPPSQTVSNIEVKLDANAKVGLSLPFPRDPGASSGVPNFKVAEFGAKFGTNGKWTQITDTANGSTTFTTGGELTGQYNGTLGPLDSEVKGVLGTSMAITRDKDNEITKVTLVTTSEGKLTKGAHAVQPDLGGKASSTESDSRVAVTTTSLDVTTPEQRAVTNAWLDSLEKNPFNYVSPSTLYPDQLSEGNPFQNLMYTNATVSNVMYDKVTDKVGFAAEVKLAVSLGVDLSLETSDSKATEASYLDTPGPDRTRPPVDFPECTAR